MDVKECQEMGISHTANGGAHPSESLSYLELTPGESRAIIHHMKSGIYTITCNDNGHFYVGQSVDIERRWYLHRNNSTKIKKHYNVLEKAFKKHGIDNFTFAILEECPVEKLDELEKYYISTMKPEYNMNEGGRGNRGFEMPEDARARLREIGKRQWADKSQEDKMATIKKLTGPKKGSHRSAETRKLLSEKTRQYFDRIGGMPVSQRMKISNALKGVSRSNDGHFKKVVGHKDGSTDVFFESVKSATKFAGVADGSISACLKGRRKTAGGYTWEYVV